ncbi:MAG: DUF4105 domain-containing protein [Alphaproteobacteria bacterium]|nr:DUF4105 domain-containing protein [Alphaproteobacteria bacterium]
MTWKPVLLAGLAALAVFIAAVLTKTPRHDRDWVEHLSVTPKIRRDGEAWRVSPVRDWRYDGDGPVVREWIEGARLDPERLQRVWLMVEPHPGLDIMAHTLVLFEFRDGGLIGLTIEARREKGETYDPLRGALGRFELIYVWATPRDLLTRRVVHLDHEVYLYRLELTLVEARAYLTSLLERSAALEMRPRFYNTLTSNCTNELAKSGRLAWHPAFILTGGAARALHGRGRIAGDDFDKVKASANMTETVRALAAEPPGQFNAALLQRLGQSAAEAR